MAIGGILFGLGMVIGGYCPGTAVASIATGKIDALVFVVGFLVGSLIFGDLFPVWGDFYNSDYMGVVRLDQALGTADKPGPKTASGKSVAKTEERVLKTYSEADIKRILGKVSGDGTTLTMKITTRVGVINCTLDRDRAPQSVTNLVALATGQVSWRDPVVHDLVHISRAIGFARSVSA